MKQAQRLFQQLAQQAVQSRTAVDVLAVVQAAVNMPLLGPFVQEAGGIIMAHRSEPSTPCLLAFPCSICPSHAFLDHSLRCLCDVCQVTRWPYQL